MTIDEVSGNGRRLARIFSDYRQTTRNHSIIAHESKPSRDFRPLDPYFASESPNTVKVADIDGDQKSDLLVGYSGANGALRVFTGDNTGRFRIRRRLMEPDETIGVALGIWMETGLSMY